MHLGSGQADFPTTRWALVAAAGDHDRPDSRQALAFLCEAYWYPLYAYARRCGDSPEQAQDHTQEFFARFLEHNYFDRADPQRGRFRSFLLASFKYYLRDDAGHSRAQKRGGGLAPYRSKSQKAKRCTSGSPSTTKLPNEFLSGTGRALYWTG